MSEKDIERFVATCGGGTCTYPECDCPLWQVLVVELDPNNPEWTTTHGNYISKAEAQAAAERYNRCRHDSTHATVIRWYPYVR